MPARYVRTVEFTRAAADDAGECCACAEPACAELSLIMENGMRERVNVCERHARISAEAPHRLASHWATKEDFIADPDAVRERVQNRERRG
jgi:hypothetical protein